MAHSHAHDHGPHGHGHDAGSTDKSRVLIAALLTGGFMFVEAAGGWLTGSLALLADAGHMLTDSIALWLAWYAFHLAGKPATMRHTYGLGRVKTLVAFVNGLTIFVVAVWIVYEAYHRFMNPGPVLGGPMMLVAVLGLMANIAGFYVLHGGDRENLNMRGAILHVLGDMLGSVAAIVAALVIIWTGWTPIDPILSVLVAVLILSTAWSLMKDAAQVLLEGAPRSMDRDGIAADLVANVKGVRGVHHMHLWSLDGSRHIATLHACLDDGAEPFTVIRSIKKRLAEEHGIDHATVEPESEQCADHGRHDHTDHDHGAHAGHAHGSSLLH
ncbi:MAG: cation diffusion facilitator family transporter [Rhizobiaceae bacterium]|nr:cation diffusion facilitator family transporter [Rhizobiaceae bacterium]